MFAAISDIKTKGSCEDELCPDSGFYLIVVSNVLIFVYWVIDFVFRTRLKVSKLKLNVLPDKIVDAGAKNIGIKNLGIKSIEIQDPKRNAKSLFILERIEHEEEEEEDWSRKNSDSQIMKFNSINSECLSPDLETDR